MKVRQPFASGEVHLGDVRRPRSAIAAISNSLVLFVAPIAAHGFQPTAAKLPQSVSSFQVSVSNLAPSFTLSVFSFQSSAFADQPAADPLTRPKHVNEATEKAIQKALAFLASTQGPDGSWRDQGQLGTYPVSMTALSGLALLASGSTPTEGPYAPNLRKALNYILGSAQRHGLICRPGEEETRSMYPHGFSMLFLGEVYGMEEDPARQEQIRRVLQAAIKLTGESQSAEGGWIYTPRTSGDEGSVTITQVQGLRACRNAGIAVPKRVIDRAMNYLEKSIQPDGGIAYRVGMVGSRPPITAAAVACWFNGGEYTNPLALKALRYCKKNIHPTGRSWGHYFYTHFYMAQIMYLSGDENWDSYYPKTRDHLVGTQFDDGSWQLDAIGRVYNTSLALLILQLPYSNLPIMQR